MMQGNYGKGSLVGTTYLEKYEFDGVLSTDALGILYKGRQIFLDRLVAVKVLGNNSISVDARKRFHEEAKAASALAHPGIAAVLDFGIDDLDQRYLVVEFIEGVTFSAFFKARQILSSSELRQIFLDLCDAVSYAHKNGVEHGNINSQNIMLCLDDDGIARPKILDFGVAKPLKRPVEAGKDSAVQSSMSANANFDHGTGGTYRDDLFGICCVLHACLSCVPLNSGDGNPILSPTRHTATSMTLPEPLNGQIVPAGFEAIAQRLLEKNPADQFESLDRLKDSLLEVPTKRLRFGDNQTPPARLPYLDGASSIRSDTPSGMSPGSNQESTVRSSDQGSCNDAFKRSIVTDDSTASESRQKTTLFWRTDLSEKMKKAQAGRFKSLSRRLNGQGDHDVDQSVRLQLSINNILLVSGAVLTVLACIAAIASLKPRTDYIRPNTSLHSPDYVPSEILLTESPSNPMDRKIADIVQNNKSAALVSTMGPCNITEWAIRELRNLKLLRAVELRNAGLDDSKVQLLADLKLHYVVLDDNEKITDQSLGYLCRIPTIEQLSLVRTGITDEGLRCLAASRSLQGLYLDDNHLITATGVEYLASGGSQLSIISLGGCALDNAVAEPLLRIKSVRYLNLARNSNVSDRTLEILRGTGSKIVSLFLAFDPITDAGVHSLTYYRDLVSLDLSGIKLSQRSIKYLASMKQLKYLYLDECALNPDQVNGLTKALPKTKIQFDRPASFKLAFNSKGEQ